ncbi:MAG: hypothetical protein HN341_14000 [Verrucomicrobia bacterium]|jgi:hypothetical protein|nr:hypothetical protein [Verrucomicrobiota bacterium]
MKKLPFVLSVVLNVVLIVAIVVLHRTSKEVTFRVIADAAAAEAQLQQYVVAELDSGDAVRIENVRQMLKRNIETVERVTADIRTLTE